MINYLLDEASYFDNLSILAIKADKSNNSADQDILNSYLFRLEEQLDKDDECLTDRILCSIEYYNLYKANEKLFETIANLNDTPKLLAIELHKLNNKRLDCKKALQKKFFNNELTEKKIQNS